MVATIKVSKMALWLVITDFIVCVIAFAIQSIYVDNDIIYFKAVDYSRTFRIAMFSVFIMLVLNSGENLDELKPLNDLATKLILFQFVIYYIDFIKQILAYDGIEIWQELYYIKKIGHVAAIFWFYHKINKLSKELSYIRN